MSDNWHKKVYQPSQDDRPENWDEIRGEIIKRDGNKCILCNKRPRITPLTVHHIIARRLGGSNHEENLVTLCRECHDEVELQDFTIARDFWRYIRRWREVYNVEYEEKPEAPVNDYHKWVYGGYKRPDWSTLKRLKDQETEKTAQDRRS